MIIQLGHTRDSDFRNELYIPLKSSSFFPEHEWILPHDGGAIDSRVTLKSVDLFIAEVSYPSTGLGIEIGTAHSYGKKILCVYKKGSYISSSLKILTNNFIEYDDENDMIIKIGLFLNE